MRPDGATTRSRGACSSSRRSPRPRSARRSSARSASSASSRRCTGRQLGRRYMPPGLLPRETSGPDRLRMAGSTVRFPKERNYRAFLLEAGTVDFTVEGEGGPRRGIRGDRSRSHLGPGALRQADRDFGAAAGRKGRCSRRSTWMRCSIT